MARRQLSVDEAREAAAMLEAGDFDNDPSRKKVIRAAVVQASKRANAPVIDKAVLTEKEKADERGSLGELFPGGDIARRTGGAVQVATTIATGAIAEPLAGISGLAAGLIGLVKGDGFAGPANAVHTAVADALTFEPRTQTGEDMLRGFAAPLQKIDGGVDYLATLGGQGNPIAETIIYSSLYAIPELLGFKASFAVRGSSRLVKATNDIKETAARLGIDLEPSQLAGSIIESAADMTPIVRAANADILREGLVSARDVAKRSALEKAASARGTKAFIGVQATEAFAQAAGRELITEGFDVPKMKRVQENLLALEELKTKSPLSGDQSVERVTAQIQDVQIISNRIQKHLDAASTSNKTRRQPKTVREDAALAALDEKLTTFLDQQFNADMITGDPRAIRRWKEAGDARKAYNERFLEDRTISQMMDLNLDPASVNKWLVGVSNAGAKPKAISTYNRIVDLLGKNHPAVKGIKSDFWFEIASPLYQEKPNFLQFIRNFDSVMKNQSHLVDAMGLNKDAMFDLRRFAGAAQIKSISPLFNLDIARSLAVLKVGSGLAKKALLVRGLTFPLRMVGRLLFGKTIVQKKGLLNELIGAQTQAPFMNPNGGAGARAIAGAFMHRVEGAIDSLKLPVARGIGATALADPDRIIEQIDLGIEEDNAEVGK